MWDKRYSSTEYVYGIRPNDFLKSHVSAIPMGNVLSLAEGEGRNAVYLAKKGYRVTAVDSSLVGLDKARQLADKNEVEIEFIHADLAEFDLTENYWDGIVSIFCPLTSGIRQVLYQKIIKGLRKNGVFLMEAFTPEQVNKSTGGGSNIDFMQTELSIRGELAGLQFEHLVELEREVMEGIFHTGTSSVVQAIAAK